MSTFLRLIRAEFIKLRRSPALRLIWLLPGLFVLVDFVVTGRFALGMRGMTPELQKLMINAPLKSIADQWSGYFHPLLIALLPALLLRPEHRFKAWKHLEVQPVGRRGFYLAKVTLLGLGFAGSLALVAVLLWSEWKLLGWLNPLARFAFPWQALGRVLGWSFLGSLPLLALYLWLADRINNAAVPVMFALVGLLLTMSLGGKELIPLWRRDFIPWVLPYTCAQQAIEDPSARQEVHSAQMPYYDPATEVVPTSKRVGRLRVTQTAPEALLKPPPPTPPWMLAVFSLVCGLALVGLGLVDSGRDRT
ncbi:MAG TPA: ABC transporter permease [Holophagaceae bacterium]|nr:ABC transporter permease [Holophagaceae bacterium]